MSRRVNWALLVAVALVALLAALATLQYRWLGDVSQAERERMRASLQTRISDFAEAFDRELTRTFISFQAAGETLGADPAKAVGGAYDAWRAGALAPEMVANVYLLDGMGEGASLLHFNRERSTLDRVDWPAPLKAWRNRVLEPPTPPGLPGLLLSGTVDATVPALVIHLPAISRVVDQSHVQVIAKPGAPVRALLVELNAEHLVHDLVDPLVAKYFGAVDQSEYLVTIVRRSDPSQVVFNSDPALPPLAGPSASGDANAGLFDLRLDDVMRLSGPDAVFERELGGASAKLAITIVRRANDTRIGSNGTGAWQVRAQFREGSLEAIVGRSRRRNAAIGAGILGLLAASVILIIASAQRQKRLATQQMAFVAAVSHELRTPLAVIRSAGENLADGIVAGDEHVKRYGTLIEGEGRRLSDMVERVLEFAGIRSGRAPRPHGPIDLPSVIADAVGSLRPDARERGITVDVTTPASPLIVAGDAEALRSALQNIIGNAIEYSEPGGAVSVRIESDRDLARVTVADSGIGIDAADVPNLFKPFFRGRRACDAQIRGTGIGLTVVKHVVDEHHGQVRVSSAVGQGTTVVIELPIAPAPLVPA